MSDPLLDAAIAQFGEHGLAGASTRAIASAAGTAMSTITYRYGGKDGLYLAAADHIARTIGERMGPVVAGATGDPVENVVAVVQGFASLMLSEESGAWARFIVREQMHPTAAFDQLWEGAMRGVFEALAGWVSAATGETDPRATGLTVLTLVGQALVFRAARAAVTRALGPGGLQVGDVAAVHARLAANVRAILKSSGGR